MTTIGTMIRGCCASLGRCCLRVAVLLRASALWVILLPIVFNVAGAASNQVVLLANHGTFPVSINKLRAQKRADENGMLDSIHIVMTSKTHLNLLADVFDFKSEGIESVGDLCIDLGSWLWTFAPFVWGFEVSRKLIQ